MLSSDPVTIEKDKNPIKMAAAFRPRFDIVDGASPVVKYPVASACTIASFVRAEADGGAGIIASKTSCDLGNLVHSLPEAVKAFISRLPEKLKAIGRRFIEVTAPKPLEGAQVLEAEGLVVAHYSHIGPAISRIDYTLKNAALSQVSLPNGQCLVQRHSEDFELLPSYIPCGMLVFS